MSIEALAAVVVFCSLVIFAAVVWRRPPDKSHPAQLVTMMGELEELKRDLEAHRKESRERTQRLESQIADLAANQPRRWAGRYELVYPLNEDNIGKI